MVIVCAAPNRAQQDPAFAAADPATKASLIGNHLTKGVTNAEVLSIANGWNDPAKTPEAKRAELADLISKANHSGSCALADAWNAPSPAP